VFELWIYAQMYFWWDFSSHHCVSI
jgi:hypothetical protein